MVEYAYDTYYENAPLAFILLTSIPLMLRIRSPRTTLSFSGLSSAISVTLVPTKFTPNLPGGTLAVIWVNVAFPFVDMLQSIIDDGANRFMSKVIKGLG